MEPKRVIFISAVSSEFHRVPPEQRHSFRSYRDVLKQAFRILAPHYEVIVQEDLVQGFGDLLETLEHEIARSLFVVHLVGDLAGLMPGSGALRNLHNRHPDLFAGVTELSQAVGDGEGITYTQWELYLAFHHDKRRLIFEAQPCVPRSPLFAPTPADRVSQDAHRLRIGAIGDHRGSFHDQGDVARKCMRSFLHFRIDPLVDPEEPSAGELAEAWEHQEEIVKQLAAAVKKPDPRAVPVTDPANVAAFVAAVRTAAERWRVNLATIVDIAARYEEQVRAAVEGHPTAQALYDTAFAELALGDYTAARFSARRAADVALQSSQQQPENAPADREVAENALLLLHEAAKAAHDIPAAIAALEEAGALIDKDADPLRWAEVHEPLAELLLDHARWDRADELVSDLIDVREEHQGENHPAVAKTLLLWTKLLYARANYSGTESVAARAERIFASQIPLDLLSVAAPMNLRAMALQGQNRLEEAEPLMRRVAELLEQSYGREHPAVAASLNNLAQLLRGTNRLAEAEPLMRRALLIDEQSFGAEQPDVARDLNNLAELLEATNRPGEAEPLMRRALFIDEQSFGAEHPNVATDLNNLAALLQATNRLAEAEPLKRRALLIDEQSFGAEHPKVARNLNNLALLLVATNRLGEAEPLMRRALLIDEQSFGAKHPKVAIRLNNLAQLLQATNRLAEAEPLMRQALLIDEQSFGAEHPNVARNLNNLALLLKATNRLADAEPLMRRALLIDERSFGAEHPDVAIDLNNLALLLKATNRLGEAEPLMRRALLIDEQSYGAKHPNVATDLNNLAGLLQATNRLAEAEPLMRRAVEIFLQFKVASGHEHPDLQTIIRNYKGLLQQMGQTEQEVQAQLNAVGRPFGMKWGDG